MLGDLLRNRAQRLEEIGEAELAGECRLLAAIIDTDRTDAAEVSQVAQWLNGRAEDWETRADSEMANACRLVADILIWRTKGRS